MTYEQEMEIIAQEAWENAIEAMEEDMAMEAFIAEWEAIHGEYDWDCESSTDW